MRYLLLLFAVSCVSSPTTYQRGTPARPPPAPVRPGVGAPVYSPGHVEPERSPHRRVLPPTREPGLWAGDQPRAARKSENAWVVEIMGVRFPSPDGKKSTAPMRVCKVIVSDALKGADPTLVSDFLVGLGPRKHACLIASLFEHCLSRRARLREGRDDHAVHRASHAAALAFSSEKCKGIDRSASTDIAVAYGALSLPVDLDTANWKEVKLDDDE